VIRSNLKENNNWIAMPINRIAKTKFMKRFYWIFLFVLMAQPLLFAQQNTQINTPPKKIWHGFIV